MEIVVANTKKTLLYPELHLVTIFPYLPVKIISYLLVTHNEDARFHPQLLDSSQCFEKHPFTCLVPVSSSWGPLKILILAYDEPNLREPYPLCSVDAGTMCCE